MKKEKNVKTIISLVIIVITLAFTGYILFNSISESSFMINEEASQLEINDGIYDKIIPISDETDIQIVSPKNIIRRTNGSALGNNLKGSFLIEGNISVYLNLSDSTLNWIEIINGDDIYYINLSNETDTINLFNNLLELQDN